MPHMGAQSRIEITGVLALSAKGCLEDTMTMLVKSIGVFDQDFRAARCIRRLCKLGIRPESISVAGANSKLVRVASGQALQTRQQGKYMASSGVSGAVIGAIVGVCWNICSPEYGFTKDLGLLLCLAVGAVLGCMLGTLIGAVVGSAVSEFTENVSNKELPGGKVLISVDCAGTVHRDAVRAIMRLSGAAAVALRPVNDITHKECVSLEN